MKKQELRSILGTVLLASFTLAPLSAAIADENRSSGSPLNSSTTRLDRDEDSVTSSLKRDGESEDDSSTSSFKIDGESRDAFSSNRGGDFKNSSSTRDGKDNKKEGNRKESDRFKMNVALTTANLLNLADRLGAIGAQIKTMVADQASSSDAIASAVSKVEGRGAFRTFLMGADYKNLGQVVSEVAKTEARLNQLQNQISKVASSSNKTALLANIQSLKDQLASTTAFVKDNTNKFSLFGWFMKRFTR